VSHHWWFGIYVAVALATFVTSTQSMRKNLVQWWHSQCSCCHEQLPIELWRKLFMSAVILVIYPLRATIWPLWLPVEFAFLVRGGMREGEKE